MKATITIDMDNAAFDEPGLELAFILRELATNMENETVDRDRKLRDTNGNTVGTFKITGRR